MDKCYQYVILFLTGIIVYYFLFNNELVEGITNYTPGSEITGSIRYSSSDADTSSVLGGLLQPGGSGARNAFSGEVFKSKTGNYYYKLQNNANFHKC